ncbi:MAG: FtsQ-type POTRA domain-containing protein [Legionella sp.]|jgi:cell division protein FtsQ|nr:FtsQ-type POTRA domain-containing protein [Legionella sp.]
MRWFSAGQLPFSTRLACLIVCACLLAGRLVYVGVADAARFPVQTVQIEATYEHITRETLEAILSPHLKQSFLLLSTQQLKKELLALDWCKSVNVRRSWPGILKVTLNEHQPMAVWNHTYITSDGILFNQGKVMEGEYSGTYLYGPKEQQHEVLQTYEKLSKLLLKYGLNIASLALRNNQAWELELTNGVTLRLGKQDLERRLQRFCRAYPAVFGDKPELLSSVDLRYARGMAVQWKQQTGK